MQITEITVTAARTFNHPHEQYSNLRPEVTLKATLSQGEDPVKAARMLQGEAEGLVEDHKRHLLRSLEDLFQLGKRQREVKQLRDELARAQTRLDEIRAAHPQLDFPEDAGTAAESTH